MDINCISNMTKNLLIVDDDDDIRDVIQASLEEFAGWNITPAASSREGLNIVKSKDWDAILLDVSMPDIDGLTMFAKLQADPITQTIPVIFLTAKVLPSDRHRFSEIGVMGVIAKPFNPVTIWKEISQILGWHISSI